MSRRALIRSATASSIVVLLGVSACGSDGEPSQTESTGESDVGVIVEIFGPRVLSTENPEFATTFSIMGDTVWFSRADAAFGNLALLRSLRTGGAWAEPDTVFHRPGVPVADPFMSHDGSRLYFSAMLPEGDGGAVSWDTWVIQRVGNHWTKPMNLGSPPNSDSVDIFVSETLEGDLVFLSNRAGRGIHRAKRVDMGWAEPEALEIPGVEGRSPGNPLISPSGDALVFAMDSDRPVREGASGPDADLFVTCREEGGWSAPRQLPEPVNSPFTDFAPGLGAEGELYFTSQRPGIVQEVPEGARRPGDLYRTDLDVEGLCG